MDLLDRVCLALHSLHRKAEFRVAPPEQTRKPSEAGSQIRQSVLRGWKATWQASPKLLRHNLRMLSARLCRNVEEQQPNRLRSFPSTTWEAYPAAALIQPRCFAGVDDFSRRGTYGGVG
jgi:hypothetical protein